ncbi:hypothetical protein Kpol_1000p22, partial [Vanderwaltozyma polyspora DSM 70294]
MSKFNALNFTPQDELLEAEEHSRELQVEESFKIFQSALFYLKRKKFDEAGEKFDELFDMAVLKPNDWGFYKFSSPTLDSLRYLAYRNRGMYYFSYLMENYKSMESDDVVTYILKVVEDLSESIQHSSNADSSVTELLVKIFKAFKTVKLERLILEYEVTRQDNQLLLLGRKKIGILPQLNLILNDYYSLLEGIKDDETLNNSAFINRLKNYSIITSEDKVIELNEMLLNIQEMKTQDEETMKKLDIFEITINDISWDSIADSLKDLIPHVKTSTLLSREID